MKTTTSFLGCCPIFESSEERAAYAKEFKTISTLAGKLTKADLVKACPGYGLEKYTKANLATRAVALHMDTYCRTNGIQDDWK